MKRTSLLLALCGAVWSKKILMSGLDPTCCWTGGMSGVDVGAGGIGIGAGDADFDHDGDHYRCQNLGVEFREKDDGAK